MPSTLRWLLIQTSMPCRTSSAAMSAWMSEKPTTKSGSSFRISPIFALVKALTLGFSLRARGGRTVKPLMPTMRSCSPSAYRTSVGSSVRQTMRRGPIIATWSSWAHDGWKRLLRLRPGMTWDSRIQHPLRPRTVGAALVQPALGQAVLRAVPELDRARDDAEPAPARRARHLAAFVLGLELRQPRLEGIPRVQRLRLPRRPRAQLAAARAAGEVGVGLGVIDDLDVALDPHLHAVAHTRPVEQQRGARIGLQFAALAPVQVGVEHEAARVTGLQQHGARGRATAGIGGGDGHRGGVRFAGGPSLGEQQVEGVEDLGRQVGHARIVARMPPPCMPYSTTKLIRRLTRHSATLPASSVTTLISLTQAPLIPFTDSAHFFRPCFTASSMLVFDEALSSMTLATDIGDSSWLDGKSMPEWPASGPPS